MPSVEQVREQLDRLSAHFDVKDKGNGIFIRCPWHAEGNERTGSLRINLDESAASVGAFNCFGCPKKGPWRRLARKLGLRQFKHEYESEVVGVTDRWDDELLGSDPEEQVVLPKGFVWPAQQEWRGIKGGLLADLGGIHYLAPGIEVPSLFLPAYVHDKLVGGVRCLIEPDEYPKIEKYKNTPGKWSSRNFFPYDYMRRHKPKTIVLVEGPRDALNLIQHGVPALCNFGAYNSWSSKKVELVLDIDPELVVLGFDPDKEGRRANRKIKRELLKWLPVKKLKLPKGKDPGKLRESEISRLRRMVSGR